MNKTGLIGANVHRSYSPAIHSFLFKKYNIVGQYKLFSVTQSQLKYKITQLVESGYKGFNVTIPFKETVMPLLDEVDESAAKIGAVNTVLIKDSKLIGYNTDYNGFTSSLIAELPGFTFRGLKCLVFGAGGASRAILYAMNLGGVKQIYLCNRTFAKAELLAECFSNVHPVRWEERESVLSDCQLIVNTTPITERFINLSDNNAVVTDIVTFPTDLLNQAGENSVSGLGMLLWQAEFAFQLWFSQHNSWCVT